MRNIKLTIQYIGTNYLGWQVQPQGQSIQGVLQEILSEILHEKIVVIGSGRTDSGVHALAQVAHFKTTHSMDLPTIQRALNAKLPWHISILHIEEVPLEFHSQKNALSKTYSYFILHSDNKIPLLTPYSWRIYGDLDLVSMEECLQMLVGRHDFNAFKAADSTAKTSVREIQSATIQQWHLNMLSPLTSMSSLQKQGSILSNNSSSSNFPSPLAGESQGEGKPYLLSITLQGQGFLKHMVRNIVGTLVEVGQGKISVEEFKRIFASRDRTQAGKTAPAWGLFLVGVEY
jgi:tRNA pseudouridine38-40 synthase